VELKLPDHLATLIRPLLEALPLERAMPELVPSSAPQGRGAQQYESAGEQAYAAATHIVTQLDDHPELQAGLWLYVDDLDRSHHVSQSIETPVGSYWHGIMHRREGDFSNAKYWFRRATGVKLSVDPVDLVDRVAAARGENPAELLELQRREWAELMERSS
jgi:hypothetical protein